MAFNRNDPNKYEMHCCIDLETLSQSSTAAILSIGAVVFDPYENDLEDVRLGKKERGTFTLMSARIDLDSCDRLGLDIEEDTLKWWAKQTPAAIEAAFSEDNRTTIEDMLKELFRFSKHCERFWAKSPSFDLAILEHAAKCANLGVPWAYHQERDIRTLEELTGLNTRDLNGHDALDDAYNEAMIVQRGYAKLRLTRPKWPD